MAGPGGPHRDSQTLRTSAFEVVAQKERGEVIAKVKNEALSGLLSSTSLPFVRTRNSLLGCHREGRCDNHSRAGERHN